MLYKFKSQATADVIMLRDSAEEILKIVGKDPGATGIITVAQIPGAVAALKAEIERRETAAAQAPKAPDASDASDASVAHVKDVARNGATKAAMVVAHGITHDMTKR